MDLPDVCSHLDICYQLSATEQQFSQFLKKKQMRICKARTFCKEFKRADNTAHWLRVLAAELDIT